LTHNDEQGRHIFGPVPLLVSGKVPSGHVLTQVVPERYAILGATVLQILHVTASVIHSRHNILHLVQFNPSADKKNPLLQGLKQV
jgi:hypothetical protein